MAHSLEELLDPLDSPEVGLRTRLERVRTSAEQIWNPQRLQWFTDHTAVRHSRRISALAGALVEGLQETQERLTRSEIFILAAAAYLHDIGMQDFALDGRGPDEFTVDDYALIRKQHPKRGRELITERSLNLGSGRDQFRIDLDDELEYLLPIGIVSQGHGSAFFEECVEEFRQREFAPENQPIRGALLTSLLLMADELDLHEDRASFPREMDQSAVTALHHHLNHYVTRVDIQAGSSPRIREILLYFAYPAGADEYQADVRAFVVDKLASQARRVNPVLDAETAGHLCIAPAVRVHEVVEATEGVRRELPEPALGLLRMEVLEASLVGRAPTLGSLQRAIAANTTTALEIEAGDESDLPSVLRWIAACTQAEGRRWIHLDCSLSVATEPEDIVRRLQSEVADCAPAEAPAEAEDQEKPRSFGEVLDAAGRGVLVLEALHVLEADTLNWLVAEVDALVSQDALAAVVLTRASNIPLLDTSTHLVLDEVSTETLARHLVESSGYGEDESATTAREMIVLSGGMAGRVAEALAARRISNAQLEG